MRFFLPFPPSLNGMYPSNKSGGRHLSKRGRAYKENVLAAVLEQHGLLKPLQGALRASVELFPPDYKIRDLDNFDGKAILDSLKHAKVFRDDKQVRERHSYMREPVTGGKCIVVIEEL